MARFILGLILLFFLIRALSRVIQGVLDGVGYRKGDSPSVGLVRDPVCGVFVVPGKALTAGAGPEAKFFCSETCRSEWKGRRG